MHDPMTVAFEIKYPWYGCKPWPLKHRNSLHPNFEWDSRMSDHDKVGRSQMFENGYRTAMVTIWHNDPQKNGGDDSCGWSYPRLTKKQIKRIHNAAWGEGQNPYFLRYPDKKWLGTRTEAESIYRGLVLFTARIIDLDMTFDEAAKYAAERIHTPDCSDAADSLCFLPGYHTNFPEASDDENKKLRQEHFAGIVISIASCLMRLRRPWYRHPRWHIWHWRIQIHPWQLLRRRLFARCTKCGKPFLKGESVHSKGMYSAKLGWFKGETDVFHDRCLNPSIQLSVNKEM